MVTRYELLNCLPPFKNEWVTIHNNQNVHDIIKEVCEAHKDFADEYDKISSFFDGETTDDICNSLYTFLKDNIQYKEESEKDQTSATPAGILTRGYGDCKHYSGFTAGVLDSLGRNGKKIKWAYRFASYKLGDKTPHHVFVVANPGTDNEIWIDPTPGANNLNPVWYIDKKVNMALRRNIGSFEELNFEDYSTPQSIGKASLTLTPKVNTNPLNWNYSDHYPGIFNPYLGLSQYRDEGGDRNLNSDQVAAQINDLINTGPHPGHAISGDFVRWIYETNLRSWNFFYPGGVRPGFSEIAAGLLPVGYPRLIVTDDGRLTFDIDVKIDDYKNPQIHILTAWAQDIINTEDESPYPVKPQHLKEFSQLKYGNVNTRNLFVERRGDSFIKEVGKAIEDSVNFLKDGVLLIVGSIPRNAFLGLVGINAFNFAGNLAENIDSGKWNEIARKWESVGGNPDKLYNTIQDGKKKKAILGQTGVNYIGAEPTSTATATLLAAAAPIIAALLTFLDKDGKAKEVLSAAKTSLQKLYPNLDLTAFGFIDKATNKPIEFAVRPQDNENLGGGNNDMPGMNTGGGLLNNPLLLAAGAGVAAYFLTGKKDFKIPLIAAGGVYFLMKK